MALHGGGFENYYHKSKVTHVVCDNLPDTKLKQLLKAKAATPIVRSAWITASIVAGKLLPASQFAIARLTVNHAQHRLLNAPVEERAALSRQEIFPQLAEASARRETPHLATAGCSNVKSSLIPQAQVQREVREGERLTSVRREGEPRAEFPGFQAPCASEAEGEGLEQRALQSGPASQRSAGLALEHGSPDLKGLQRQPPRQPPLHVSSSERVQHSECEHDGRTLHVPGVQQDAGACEAVPDSPEKRRPACTEAATWTSAHLAKAQKTAAAMRAACDVLKGAPKSSADDPKFLETYFRSSRLHFIGTWKMRIEALMQRTQRTASSGPKRTAIAPVFAAPAAKRQKKARCAAC